MKLLETQASRYDLGMRMLSIGRIQRLYAEVAAHVPEQGDILDVGCGTGGVTAALLTEGLTEGRQVTGVDRSPQMLAVAETKLAEPVAAGRLRLRQVPITGLEREFPAESFDAVVCCLVLSELSATEESYALDVFCRLLRPGGTLVLADEVTPDSPVRRWLYRVGRWPMAALTYVVTQTGTHATRELDRKLTDRGLETVRVAHRQGQSFQIVTGRKPAWRLQPQP
ncbi:corrinoid protein-associated methyltransferase CpaM [Actinophytocola sp. NPDC049390]|uniref:corrinoid protein-associated methyltransferase CpaM n=1 Tax=Actinophytocola sp. NPDC049390 TaxID=3363894 RepID=UPI0037AF42FC